MITGSNSFYILECDVCGAEAEGESFFDFYDAVAWKKDKDNRWISRKVNGVWEDVCPECHESFDADKED